MRTLSPYHRHRFPAEIISHSVWLYFRFALSFRDVEEMLAQRGVVLTYETIRAWCLKFGQTYANDLRRKSPRPGDKWYLDEVFLKINGSIHYGIVNLSENRWKGLPLVALRRHAYPTCGGGISEIIVKLTIPHSKLMTQHKNLEVHTCSSPEAGPEHKKNRRKNSFHAVRP